VGDWRVSLAGSCAHGLLRVHRSWRRKSTTNSPLSYFATFDPVTRRSKPLALAFSANIKQATLVKVLGQFKQRVEAFARNLLAKEESTWPRALRGMRDKVQAVAEHGFQPRVGLIDKSAGERNSLKNVFAGIRVRLCFWHMKQAIERWEGNCGETPDDHLQTDEAAPLQRTIVPRNIRPRLYRAFLLVARCETEADFQTARADFLDTQIDEIVRTGAADRTEAVKTQIAAAVRRYFERNWFVPAWQPCFADYAIPADIPLGDCNTNNICEAAFKVLDRTVLAGRFHISTAVILLRRFWPYTDRQEPAKLSPAHEQSLREGGVLWELGCASPASPVSGNVYQVTRSNGTLATVDISKTRHACNVPACTILPSPCKHFYAANLRHNNGPVDQWMKGEDVGGEDEDEGSDRSSDDERESEEALEDEEEISSPISSISTRTVAYTPSIHLAGLVNRWPRAAFASSAVNFQLGKRKPALDTSGDEGPENERPAGKRAHRTSSGSLGSFARAVSVLLPRLFVAADQSRIKEPFYGALQHLVGFNKELFRACLDPARTPAPAVLLEAFVDPILRKLPDHAGLAAAVEGLFGTGAHRPVAVSSPCCRLSHSAVKVPSIFHVDSETYGKFGTEASVPVGELLCQSMVVHTPNFRIKTCSAEPPCRGLVDLHWPTKGLNHVLVSVLLDEGVRADLTETFAVQADGVERVHRLAGVLYTTGSGAAWVVRGVEDDGTVIEYAVGTTARTLTGSPKKWKDWTQVERSSAAGKEARVALYALARPI
jgi:hypothetical protein